MNLHIQPELPTGPNNERRFAEALAQYDPHEPSWFLGLDETSSILDLRGVDFIAWVKYPKRREPMPVPIQIKSSEGGRAFYYEKHPQAKTAGVIVLVLGKKDSASTIRGRLFSELAKVREAGTVYEEYLYELRTRRVTRRGHLLIHQIEERRRLRRPDAAAEPARPSLRFLPIPLGPWEKALVWTRRLARSTRKRLGGRRAFERPPMASPPSERTSPAQ